jgi:hypothetical protein
MPMDNKDGGHLIKLCKAAAEENASPELRGDIDEETDQQSLTGHRATISVSVRKGTAEKGVDPAALNCRFAGSTNLSGVGPVHAADLSGRVTAMCLGIRR